MTIIDEIIKISGLNAAKFAKIIGVHPTQIYDLQSGKTKSISPSMADKILKVYPNFCKLWLLTGEGEMLVADEPHPIPEISFKEGVPYYDVDFQLGFDEFEGVDNPNPEYLIRMPGYEKATLWCNASGHSMEPEINHGDILALQRIYDFSFLPFGDIYGFITTNGMRTIKRLGRSPHQGYYRLIPTNKEYDEQEIPISSIAIVYRVMGAMKAF